MFRGHVRLAKCSGASNIRQIHILRQSRRKLVILNIKWRNIAITLIEGFGQS